MNVYQKIREGDTQFQENEPHGWIQWKGTDVCADLYCICGFHGHVDGDFFYGYECKKCGQKYGVGMNIKLIPLTEKEAVELGHTFYIDESEE